MLLATELAGDTGRGGSPRMDCDINNCVSSSISDESEPGDDGGGSIGDSIVTVGGSRYTSGGDGGGDSTGRAGERRGEGGAGRAPETGDWNGRGEDILGVNTA